MARSASSKNGSGLRKRSRGAVGKFFILAGLCGVVVVGVVGFIAYLSIRSYLHSDGFRVLVGDQTSSALDAAGEFEAFEWAGKSMYSRSFSAQGSEDAFFSRMKAHQVRARVSLGGVTRGVWEIPSVKIDKFDFVISDDRVVEQESTAEAGAVDGGGGGGFFSGLIPQDVEIQEVELKEVNFNIVSAEQSVAARGIRAKLKPTSAADGYAMVGRSGTLTVDGLPPFEIDDFNLRTGGERLYLDHAALRFHRSARVQLSGDVETGELPEVRVGGVLSGLDLADVLSADWVKKLKGLVEGEFKLTSASDGGLVTSGTLTLSNGSLEALPILKRVDALAGTTRFRKLNFSEVEVEFEKRAGELELGEVLFESSGLGCLKGRMARSASGEPSGIYMLGVSPDTLKWIPVGRKEVVQQVFRLGRDAAFAEVFPGAQSGGVTKPPDGYRWMVVRIDPTVPDAYTADIRRQFIEAGGLAIWAELQGLPERVVQAAGEVARVAGDQGVDLISMLAEEGFGSESLKLTEGMVENLGETLKIDDLFEEGTAIPKAILDSGFDVINELNPLRD